jgi:flagellar protein FliL
MAEELDDDLEEREEALPEEEEEIGRKGGRKPLLIYVAIAVLLVLIGIATAWFTGLLDPVIEAILGEEEAAEEVHAEGTLVAGDAVFYDLPEILVNLNTGGRKSTFLKIRVSLELRNPRDIGRVESVMPRIMDNFQVYLRELRVEDLKGSAGMYRLREELLARVNAAAAPAAVDDVLFKEMLVQ